MNELEIRTDLKYAEASVKATVEKIGEGMKF